MSETNYWTCVRSWDGEVDDNFIPGYTYEEKCRNNHNIVLIDRNGDEFTFDVHSLHDSIIYNKRDGLDDSYFLFKRAQSESTTLHIVCAACKIEKDGKEVILCGARHWDRIMHTQADAMGDIKVKHKDQGFIDQFGFYLNRKDAMNIVKATGQKFDQERNGGSGDELYSEGLY